MLEKSIVSQRSRCLKVPYNYEKKHWNASSLRFPPRSLQEGKSIDQLLFRRYPRRKKLSTKVPHILKENILGFGRKNPLSLDSLTYILPSLIS